ncbi:heme peroxidase [Mycena capillaripes]|nr:heme peroxidase [Mycena capillaripes]
MFLRLKLLFFVAVLPTNAYLWPSPQLEELESLRFEQQGFNAGDFSLLVQTCDESLEGQNTGRNQTSNWVRMTKAYHDMATHNVHDGTGGLDGSIRFAEELAHAENVGDGFGKTLSTIFSDAFTLRHVTTADAIALLAVLAVENCGGPEIAFRGGRIDAVESNAPGLVACRHTFGGVQHDPFPDIVGELNDPNSTEDVAHFDSTFVTFDNNIANEYISGTTQNPLVVGFNETTNSDRRIFGSDGNVTMSSFAKSLKLYTSTCADLFARMLDTVPRGVQLTDVITPLLVKPSNVELTLDGDTLNLFGQVRFWNMKEDALARGGKYNAAWYSFNATSHPDPLSLNATGGLKSLRFVVDGKLEDQGGLGFPIQDSFMFSQTTCLTSQNSGAGQLDVAVRNGVNPTRLYLEQVTTDDIQRHIIVELDIPPPAQPVAANPAYSKSWLEARNPSYQTT